FASLSGVHARLVRASDSTDKADRWLLEDLGSTNGTFVGGERLKPGVKLPVTTGTQIKVAEINLIFDGALRAHGAGAGAVHADSPNKVVTGNVQAAGANKATGKVQAEPSNRVTGKVEAEGSG